MATNSIIVTGNTATSATPIVHAKCSGPKAADDDPVSPPFSAQLIRRVCGHFLRAAAAAVVCYSFAVTAWRVRHDPQDLAFVAAALSLLAALLACLRRAERLTPDSPAGERRHVQAAVWALSTALSCAFAYRVAAVMPLPLAVLVWCMTAFVALVGLYLLVLCRDQQYQALPDDDAAIASDRKGVPWSGMKKVFAMTGRMLRGWLPMFKLNVQEKLEKIIQLVEEEASSVPLIGWKMDISESGQSSAQLSEDSGNVIKHRCNRC